MKKSELREMVREMVQEALAGSTSTTLQEAVEGPGYIIKAWADPEQKGTSNPTFNSAAKGIKYDDYAAVIKALQTAELDELGAYEIIWVKSGTAVEK